MVSRSPAKGKRAKAKAQPIATADVFEVFQSLFGGSVFGGAEAKPKRSRKAKLGQVPVSQISVDAIRPAPENDRVYKPVSQRDDTIIALSVSIKVEGLLEPLVITLDGYIVSGHRRFAAAKLAGLTTVPCRVLPITRADDLSRFVKLLTEFNRQREKSFDEKLREQVIATDPTEAWESLHEHREQRAAVSVPAMELENYKQRCRISPAKMPFLQAINRVLDSRRDFWPISDRAVHYGLLNNPPLKHAGKPDSIYTNTIQSYKALVDLITRARLRRWIPFGAISDETRPVSVWDVHRETTPFIRRELDQFLKRYRRDLMQSQPNHIEIVAEKNTIAPILEPVAGKYSITMTTGRGFCSLPPRQQMALRFRESGKRKLVLLIVSDHDPDGEQIARSFARSMRDDFNVRSVHAVKVALTANQVQEYQLPPSMTAKTTSVNYAKFSAEHGDDVFELEALEPNELQQILESAIESVIDQAAFENEVQAEKADAQKLEALRVTINDTLKDINFGTDNENAD